MNMWRKLNHLVPQPQCETRDGVITMWTDVRDQPSDEVIEAVDMADVLVSEQDRADEQGNTNPRDLLKIIWKMFNSIRQLEGKQPLTWKAFIKRVRENV